MVFPSGQERVTSDLHGIYVLCLLHSVLVALAFLRGCKRPGNILVSVLMV